MKNLDVIILTGFVILSFLSFFISTFRAFEKVNKKDVNKFKKGGIISRLLAYFESFT